MKQHGSLDVRDLARRRLAAIIGNAGSEPGLGDRQPIDHSAAPAEPDGTYLAGAFGPAGEEGERRLRDRQNSLVGQLGDPVASLVLIGRRPAGEAQIIGCKRKKSFERHAARHRGYEG